MDKKPGFQIQVGSFGVKARAFLHVLNALTKTVLDESAEIATLAGLDGAVVVKLADNSKETKKEEAVHDTDHRL